LLKYKISASILNVDFLSLADEIDSVIEYIDELHLDICDGTFVPSLSFGGEVTARIGTRYHKQCHIDAHLMVMEPQEHVSSFIAAGSRSIIFHLEAHLHPLTLMSALQSKNIAAGIGIIPKTPAAALASIADFCDRVLIMTVNPGFGNQRLITPMLKKVEEVRKIIGDEKDIIVDGGINDATIRDAKNAGANIFVVGSALFKTPARREYIEQLRALL